MNKELFIIYDDLYEDTDIVSVPQIVFDSATQYAQEFCDFVAVTNDDSYFVLIDGEKCRSLETDGFVNWLNNIKCLSPKSNIVKQHTKYIDGFPKIEF